MAVVVVNQLRGGNREMYDSVGPRVMPDDQLRDGGHEVAICSAPSFRSEVAPFGYKYFEAGLDWLTSDQSTWSAFGELPPPGPDVATFAAGMFADVTTAAMV